MSRYDWLLFLHVLGAFAMTSAITVSTIVVVGFKRARSPQAVALLATLGGPAAAVMGAGSLVTLAFGVWLALDAPQDYGIFDEWIVAALVLWLVGTGASARADRIYRRAGELAADRDEITAELRAAIDDPRALVLHLVGLAGVVGALLMMVFKPLAN